MTLSLTTTRPFNANICMPWKGIRRVALKPDGTIYKYHNSTTTGDTTNAMFDDGTTMLWTDYETAGYNCMVEIPKFYYKKVGYNESATDFTSGHAWYISDVPKDGFEVHPAFFRCRDKLCNDQTGVAIEVNYRYAPAFLGFVDTSNKLRSLPFKDVKRIVALTTFRIYSANNGNGWGVMDYNLWFAIQLLYSIEYGNYDSQTALGKGLTSGSTYAQTGGTLQSGNNNYGEVTGTLQMSYRGIEDLWGNVNRFIDGFFVNSSLHLLIGNKGFNDLGTGYIDKGVVSSITTAIYPLNIQSEKSLGFTVTSGDVYADKKFYEKQSLKASCIPNIGGYYPNGAQGGIFFMNCLNLTSATVSTIGSALSY